MLCRKSRIGFLTACRSSTACYPRALRDGDDEAARRESFQAIRRRIRIMSQLHRRVARTYSFGDLLESHCRRESVSDLVRCFGREDVTPWVEVSDVTLPLAREQRLVLLMVELVTNAH